MTTVRLIAFGLFFLLLGVLVGWLFSGTKVTTTALSPDDQTQVVLVELNSYLDRNFAIRLGPSGAKPSLLETIFKSPDEGRPVGSERFIWSKDGRYILLVGRHFFVNGKARNMSGEYLYLLYHLPTKRIWCNASQTRAERFGFRELHAIEFTDPITEGKNEREPPD
jgi:hypothetical protein